MSMHNDKEDKGQTQVQHQEQIQSLNRYWSYAILNLDSFLQHYEIVCEFPDYDRNVLIVKIYEKPKSRGSVNTYKIDFNHCVVYHNGRKLKHVQEKDFMAEVQKFLLYYYDKYQHYNGRYHRDGWIGEDFMDKHNRARNDLILLVWSFLMWAHGKKVPVLGK